MSGLAGRGPPDLAELAGHPTPGLGVGKSGHLKIKAAGFGRLQLGHPRN